jgi:hypothetical protein
VRNTDIQGRLVIFARPAMTGHATSMHAHSTRKSVLARNFETKNLSVVRFNFGAPGSRRYDETRASEGSCIPSRRLSRLIA